MINTNLPAVLCACLCALSVGPARPLARAQEKRDERYSSPRATVRTLLTVITLARSNPELLPEAVACLDLGGLPPGQQNTAGVLAGQLETVLRAGGVDTNLIPDQVKEDVYVLPDRQGRRIALQRQPDGRWVIDRDTVALVPRMYADTLKQLQERNKEAAALNVAPEHASPRATARTALEGYRAQDIPRVLGCMDLGEVPAVAREEVGTQLAHKLRQIIVRHRLPILQEVPESNYSDPVVFVSQPEGIIELVRIPSGDRKGEWLFSRATVRSIDRLYAAYEDKPYLPELAALGSSQHIPGVLTEPEIWLRSHLPGWLRASMLTTRTMRLEVYELLGYMLVPVVAFGVYRLTTWLLVAALQWLLARRDHALPRETLLRRLRPAGRFVGLLFLRWGLLVLEPDRVVLVPILAVLNPVVWVLGMWALFRLIDLTGDAMEAHPAVGRRPEITQMLWPVGSLAVKIVLFVVLVFHLMTLFSWDLTAVLTGLGIGGLAFALGAQDALKNLFGSFTLLADRPFVVGEVVKIGGHELGVIEVVGLRSTRIRTSDDTLLIVPNSNLTTLDITNYGRRRYRRYMTRLGVAYATPPEKLIAFRGGLQELIRGQKRTRKDRFDVAIHDLGASAVEVLVNVFFEVANYQEELEARDALILDILRLADDLNVELAYPTQTVHLVPSNEPASHSVDGREEVRPTATHVEATGREIDLGHRG